MLSGIKEIVIIIVVLVGLFMLPRLLRRGSVSRTDHGNPTAINDSNRGVLRLAWLCSLLWVALAAVFLNPFAGNVLLFCGVGVLPVGLGWGIRWVVLGFK